MNERKFIHIQVECQAVNHKTVRELSNQENAELAKTFQEDAEKLYASIEFDLTNGRVFESEKNLGKLLELTLKFSAQPLITLTQEAIELAKSKNWTELLKDHLPKIATVLQGTVNLLQEKELLSGNVRLPEEPTIERLD